MQRWFNEHPKAETLFYSCIWLVYTLSVFAELQRMPSGWRKWTVLSALLAFIVVYVRIWIVYPVVPPPGRRMDRGLYASIVVLFAGQLAISTLGEARNLTLSVFVASVIAYALPSKQFMRVSPFFVVGLLVEAAWFVHEGRLDKSAAAFLCLFVLGLFGIFSSFAQLMASNRQLQIANESVRQLVQSQERERISADLHDILGQSLTVITLKAQLLSKLLEKHDGTPKVREEIEQIKKLSCDALADVRAVVRDARRLNVADEIFAARQLLLAAGVKPVVTGAPVALGEQRESVAALVVREATANVVHHAAATQCRIRTWAAGVSITDDGADREDSPSGRRGTGLRNLAERVERVGGRLEYGRTRKGWRVSAEFAPDMFDGETTPHSGWRPSRRGRPSRGDELSPDATAS